MACDCDELGNRIRRLEDEVRRLRGGGSSGTGGGNQPIDIEKIIKMAVERTYSDKRWKDNELLWNVVIKGKV